jgi:hypothetical protein
MYSAAERPASPPIMTFIAVLDFLACKRLSSGSRVGRGRECPEGLLLRRLTQLKHPFHWSEEDEVILEA